jgi:hypothetical protein
MITLTDELIAAKLKHVQVSVDISLYSWLRYIHAVKQLQSRALLASSSTIHVGS